MKRAAWSRPRVSVTVAVASMLIAFSTGCVRRTVTINTDPQGAAVMLNDQHVGTSPVVTDFTWYGDYDVVLRKDGYETLATNHRLNTPWYELPGIDLISEAVWPFSIHDQHTMSFTLKPRQPTDKEALLKQAVEVRERTLFRSD